MPIWGMYGCGKNSLILIPFRLPQISCFTLGLKCCSSDSFAPVWGKCPASVPPSTESRSSPTYTVCPSSSFILLSFAWFYIFFSTGQVLLSALSWCSAFTSVSEGVFLMYPWGEMYSTSTYSSAILFSTGICLLNLCLSVVSLSVSILNHRREDETMLKLNLKFCIHDNCVTVCNSLHS